MKHFIFVLSFLANATYLLAQDYWVYKLTNVGYITLPKTMEVQGGDFKKVAESFQKQLAEYYDYELPQDRVVFQRKGVNDRTANFKDSYAKIIFQTIIETPGQFDKLNKKIELSKQELQELNLYFRAITEEDMYVLNLILLKWNGVSIVTINGISALKISYIRQQADWPPVETNIYRFFNNDRMHSLTFSYRKADEAIWKPIFDNILKSFKITNIR